MGKHPQFAKRVRATGPLEATEAATHIASRDVMLQPYPDGVSSRCSSVMAAPALGGVIVTNEGELSETIWRESAAVELASAGRSRKAVLNLLDQPQLRHDLGQRGLDLYRSRFAIEHTISAIRAVGSRVRENAG